MAIFVLRTYAFNPASGAFEFKLWNNYGVTGKFYTKTRADYFSVFCEWEKGKYLPT